MNVEGPFTDYILCKLQANLSEFCLLPAMRIKYVYPSLKSSKTAIPRLLFTICIFRNNRLRVYILWLPQRTISQKTKPNWCDFYQTFRICPIKHILAKIKEKARLQKPRSFRHRAAFLLNFCILMSFVQYVQSSMKAIQFQETTALSFFFFLLTRKSYRFQVGAEENWKTRTYLLKMPHLSCDLQIILKAA